jgi:hypothetical protein
MQYTNDLLAQRLASAVTSYDRRRCKRRDYNHYALGIYLMRCDDIVSAVERGESVRNAVFQGFTGDLRDHVLSALQPA